MSRLIVLLGLSGSIICLLSYLVLPQFGFSPISSLVVGYGLYGVPFLGLTLLILRSPHTTTSIPLLVIWTLLSRMALVWIPPLLSEDIWRYLWDGEVFLAGLNPYAQAPSDSSFDAWSNQNGLNTIRSMIGHGHLPTVYPPTAEITFLGTAYFGSSVTIFRLLSIFADCALVFVLCRWLERKKMDQRTVSLYAFCPVSVLESAVGSHIDTIGVAALVIGLYAAHYHKPIRAGIALTWAAGIKLVPFAVVFPLWTHRRRSAVVTVGISGLLAMWFYSAFNSGPRGLTNFAQRWRGNDGLFSLLYGLGEFIWPNDGRPIDVGVEVAQCLGLIVGRTHGTQPHLIWPDELVFGLCKIVCAAILFAVVLREWVSKRTSYEFWFSFMGTVLLISPIIHPWYLVWVLPFVCLLERRQFIVYGGPFLVWSCTVFMAYIPRITFVNTGEWHPLGMIKWLEYLPVLMGFVIGLVYLKRHERDEETVSAKS